MVFQRKDLFTLNYYKKKPYTASCNGTRIRLFLADEGENKVLKLATWPEPFAYDKTADDLKSFRSFPYSEEGILEIISWLNENLACKEERK